MLVKPKVWKEPVTADMLKAMVEAAGSDPSLTEVRLLAVCLVAFMRCDELVKLKCADVTFNAEGMVVRIESNKTDQYLEIHICTELIKQKLSSSQYDWSDSTCWPYGGWYVRN